MAKSTTKKEGTGMITIGVDFHKKTSSYKVLDRNGQPIMKRKLKNDPEVIGGFLESIPGPKQLAMEATRSWGLYYECVKDKVDKFCLGHPKKMNALSFTESKNDTNDADIIARMAHAGFLPQAHVTTLTTRELRSLVRFRGFLVNQRRAVRNHIHALIDRNIWHCHKPKTFKDVFCKRGREWLANLKIGDRERFILDGCLKSFDQLNESISEVEKYIKCQEYDLPDIKYLRTVPGFMKSVVNIYCVLVEASDITRFPKAKAFTRYAGLIPREYSSGDKHTTGRLIKGANMHLRTAIIESTLSAIRLDKGLRKYYLQVKARGGSGDAIIATARKLSYAIYHVLREKRSYRYENVLPPAAACHPFSISCA
jgi:transposase